MYFRRYRKRLADEDLSSSVRKESEMIGSRDKRKAEEKGSRQGVENSYMTSCRSKKKSAGSRKKEFRVRVNRK